MKFVFDLLSDTEKSSKLVGLAILLVLLYLFIPDYNLLECNAPDQPCILSSNFLGIKRSKKFFKPEEIVSYDAKYNFFGSSKRSRYYLSIYNKHSVEYKLFDDYRFEYQAKNAGERIINCISGKHYPCVIKKY